MRKVPGPEDYSTYEVNNGEVTERRTGCPPERADLIYSYRPLGELPGIIATAKELGAKTIWSQSGLPLLQEKMKGCWVPEVQVQMARNLVESAGLYFISEPYIGDAACEIRELGSRGEKITLRRRERREGLLLIFWGAWGGWRRGDLMGFASGWSLDYFGGLLFWFFLFAATSVSVSHVQ